MSEQSYVPAAVGEGYFTDWQAPALGLTDDAKVWAFNAATRIWEPVALAYEPAGAVTAHAALVSGVHGISAFGATLVNDADAATARSTLGLGTLATVNVPGATTQVISNQAGVLTGDAGLTYDAANDALTVAGRVVTGVIRPAANSTTAVQVQTATGTGFIVGDSTNLRLGVGSTTAPTEVLHVQRDQNAQTAVVIKNTTTGTAARAQLRLTQDDGLGMLFYVFSSGYTNSALFQARTGLLDCNLANGFNIGASNATGTFRISTGGLGTANERVLVQADGLIKFGFSGGAAATALLDLAASTTTRASLRIRPGTFPTGSNRNDGDIGYVSSGRLTFYRGGTEEIIPTAAAQSAYTQTYSTAARTVNAYTTDAESAAYTGIDNLQVGSVYAQLSDLNQLRVAYENLRAMADNLIQVVNSLIDDGQAFGMT